MTGKKKNAKKLLNVNKLCKKKQQVITRNVLTWGVTVGLDPFSRCISPSSLPHPGLSTSSSRPSIHPKSWILWIPESTDNFEFSAEGLSENTKSIKITLFVELLTVISPIYVQSLLNLSIKTLKHDICPIDTKFL